MDDPKLATLLRNTPGNFLQRLEILEQQMEDLLTLEGPTQEELSAGRSSVFTLALFPAEGILVTDPTSTDYTGGFITGDGLDFGGDTYVLGNVVNGTIKTGFTDVGTLYAIDAYIDGTVVIGPGSEAGGWLINATQIYSSSFILDSSIPAMYIGSASDIMTGAGVFIGNDSGTYKMRIGDPAGNYLLWNGATLSASGQWIKSAGMNPALQEWETNIVFSSASDTQVNWTSGTIVLSDGTSYSISSGNTGTMAALTYIYLDIAVSSTVLQKTTTYSTATGDGKILIAAAQNASAGASVLPFGGQQPLINGGAQITALSILAGNIAAGAITASKISVTSLSAITATMGALTIDSTLTMSGASGAITIGTTPPSSATTGTGLWIDRTGVYSLSSNVQNATLTSSGLTAGAGAVKLNTDGASIDTASGSYANRSALKFVNGATLVGTLSSYQSGSTQNFLQLIAERSSNGGFLKLYAYGTSGGHVEIVTDNGTDTSISLFEGARITLNNGKRSIDTRIYGNASARPVFAVIGSDKRAYIGDTNTAFAAWIPITKPSIEQIQSDTTLSADTDLQFPVAANQTYIIKIRVIYRTPAAADFKFDLNGPASPSRVFGNGYYIAPGAVAKTDIAPFNSYATTATSILSGVVDDAIIDIDVFFEKGANAGTFSFRWAQVTSSANNTSVLAGSFMMYTIVAASL